MRLRLPAINGLYTSIACLVGYASYIDTSIQFAGAEHLAQLADAGLGGVAFDRLDDVRRLHQMPGTGFAPVGQGVGAIDELVPAGDLVRSLVTEAEAVLDRVSSLR